jgi:hypothetical protein
LVRRPRVTEREGRGDRRRLLALFRSCSNSMSSGSLAINRASFSASSSVSRLSEKRWRPAAAHTHGPAQGHWHRPHGSRRGLAQIAMVEEIGADASGEHRCPGAHSLWRPYCDRRHQEKKGPELLLSKSVAFLANRASQPARLLIHFEDRPAGARGAGSHDAFSWGRLTGTGAAQHKLDLMIGSS